MLFVIDVGNTNTVLGIYENGQLVADWRIQTHDGRTADEHGTLLRQLFDFAGIDPDELRAAVMSSVVPPMEPSLEETARRYLGLELAIVGRDLSPSMPVRIPNPEEVGADRLINALAAWNLRNVPQVVVDFGTATTFDAISMDGEYVGGAIAPGVTISSEALFETASKLPRVELTRPESVIGRTTVESMQSGLTYGYIGLVREIVGRMRAQLEGEPRVVATGGRADLLADEPEIVDIVDKQLTLKGLRDVYEAESPSSNG
ncbi:MAG: type III pantothenate kinase [Bradymonadaceae bacterium]